MDCTEVMMRVLRMGRRATRTVLFAAITLAAWASVDPAHADGDAIATVNGQAVSKKDLVDALLESHGLELFQQLVLLDLAKQETKKRGIKVSAADVEREYADSLDRIAADAGITGATATPENKEQALDAMLATKRLSRKEFRISIERNAHLRKLVESDVPITDATLRAEFARTYGERRVVRHIQLPVSDAAALNETLNLLKTGTDFAEVARRMSRNADRERGGEMEPFAFNSDLPAALREAAFALQEGDVSTPIRTEQMLHILKLERVIPPDGARFEEVRDQIERGIRARIATQEMQKRSLELFKAAKVNVMDARLKRQYEEFLRQQSEAAP